LLFAIKTMQEGQELLLSREHKVLNVVPLESLLR
jgi:hypothetical protein